MRKNCDNCNFNFDKRMDSCPKCNTLNNDHIKTDIKNPFLFLDIISTIIIFASYFIFNIFIALCIQIISNAIDPNLLSNNFFLQLVNLLMNILIVFTGIFVLSRYKHLFLKQIKSWKPYILGLLFGLILMCVNSAVSNIFTANLPQNSNQLEVVKNIIDQPILSFFTVVIFGPIAEELTFRVGLMSLGSKVSRKHSRLIAYLFSTLIFAFIHINIIPQEGGTIDYLSEFAAFPSYLVSGFILSLVYEKFGFASSTLAHIINNLFSFVLLISYI